MGSEAALSHKQPAQDPFSQSFSVLCFTEESRKIPQLEISITRIHFDCTMHGLLKAPLHQFPRFWLLQVLSDVLPVTFCCICLFVWNRLKIMNL